jgi:adenylylsulfate reductase subunit B
MPAYVNPGACDACAGVHQGPICVYICPNDLMVLDQARMKGLNREPEMCSECFACVKLCPQEAVQVRGYADFVPLGASVKPRRNHSEITWVVTFRDGRTMTYTYPVRSTPVGSTDPYRGFSEPRELDLRSSALGGEETWLGVSRLPAPRS